jgi:hypothetical protein
MSSMASTQANETLRKAMLREEDRDNDLQRLIQMVLYVPLPASQPAYRPFDHGAITDILAHGQAF